MDKYKDFVDMIKEDSKYKGIVNEVSEQYKDVTPFIDSEITAKYVEKNMGDEKFIKSLINYDSNIALKLFDDVKAMFSSNEKTRVENAWKRAFEEYKTNGYQGAVSLDMAYSLVNDDVEKINNSVNYVDDTKQTITDFINEIGKSNFSWEAIQNNPDLVERVNQMQNVLNDFGTSIEDYADSLSRKVIDSQIANEYYEEITQGKAQGKNAFIVIGPPASGKSSVIAKHLINSTGAIEIDSDAIKERLPEYQKYGGVTANYLHQESSNIAVDVQNSAIDNGYNIVLPLVGKNTQKIDNLIDHLKSKGYDTIELYDVELPTDKTKAKVISRFAETGRYLAPSYLDSVGDKPSKTFELLKNKEGVTYYAKYDNDVNFGEKAKLLESGGTSITETTRNNLGTNNKNIQGNKGKPGLELGRRNGEINQNATNGGFLNVNSSQENSEKSHKQKQLEIIEKFNPRDNTLSSSHTWIDSVDDIHTYDEVANPNEDVTPDFKANDIQNVLDTGEMIVYSSHPIEKGTWVTPSLMEAQNYAENGQIYSERISTNDVAWVDNIQGMYAPVNDTNGVITKDSTGKVLTQEQQKYFANSKDIRYSLGNKVNNDNNVDTNVQSETTRLGDELANHGLTPERQVQAEYQNNIDVYGAFKNGGEPRVDRIVPQATDYRKNSEFARNMAESQTVDDSHFKELQEAVNNGAFAYVERSNKVL